MKNLWNVNVIKHLLYIGTRACLEEPSTRQKSHKLTHRPSRNCLRSNRSSRGSSLRSKAASTLPEHSCRSISTSPRRPTSHSRRSTSKPSARSTRPLPTSMTAERTCFPTPSTSSPARCWVLLSPEDPTCSSKWLLQSPLVSLPSSTSCL